MGSLNAAFLAMSKPKARITVACRKVALERNRNQAAFLDVVRTVAIAVSLDAIRADPSLGDRRVMVYRARHDERRGVRPSQETTPPTPGIPMSSSKAAR